MVDRCVNKLQDSFFHFNVMVWVASFRCFFSLHMLLGHWPYLSHPGYPGLAMLALRHRNPDWTEIFASHFRLELCTLIVSFLYDQHSEERTLPRDIWRFSWCSHRIFRCAVRFRVIETPSVADDGSSDWGWLGPHLWFNTSAADATHT